jgi:acetyl-CoA acetyltransferase
MRTRTDIAAAYTGASGAAYDRMPAIAGVGCTPFYRRGGTVGRTAVELACAAILDSLWDAGLTADDVDGFALFSGGLDVGLLVETLGIPEIRFAATVAGSGGGSAGSVGLASAAIASGMASVVVSVVAVQQLTRMGAALAPGDGSGQYAARPTAQSDFTIPAGLLAPGQAFAMIAARHMHEFGTRREDFAEVAISTRANATRRETALMRTPLTLEQYLDSRIIADPLCRGDRDHLAGPSTWLSQCTCAGASQRPRRFRRLGASDRCFQHARLRFRQQRSHRRGPDAVRPSGTLTVRR